MHPETLLPQPLLFNAALYAAIALVYSVAFFTIDHTQSEQPRVFDDESKYRDPFAYLAICSWPVLLFGGLILIAVRVGANVRRSRRRRSGGGRRRHRPASRTPRAESSASRGVQQQQQSRSRSHTPRGRRRASSAPPSVSAPNVVVPPSTSPPGAPALPLPLPLQKRMPAQQRKSESQIGAAAAQSADDIEAARRKRHHSDYVRSGTAARLGAGGRAPSGTPGASSSNAALSKRSSKRSKALTRGVPRGFVSVTRAQKAYAAIGFLWVAAGLAATASQAALVFIGHRERLRRASVKLNEPEGAASWLIPIFTGLIFVFLFAVLAVGTAAKFVNILRPTSPAAEMRTVSLDDEEAQPLPPDVSDAALAHHLKLGYPRRADDLDLDDDDDDFIAAKKASRKVLAVSASASDDDDSEDDDDEEGRKMRREIVDGRPIERFSMPLKRGTESDAVGAEDWHALYWRGAHLPYQPDEPTVERMMRQLRDMGFPSAHQNIAALQAASYDLEIASDKLANAQMGLKRDDDDDQPPSTTYFS